MTDTFKTWLWANFGGVIDMLMNVMALCPNELWKKDRKFFYEFFIIPLFRRGINPEGDGEKHSQ